MSAETTPPRPWLTSSRAIGLLLVAALALMGHALVIGAGPTENVNYNGAWVQDFAASVRHGQWAPHWAPTMFDGLGAPCFYFYPPLAFYVAALVRTAGGGGLDYLHLLAWTEFAMMFASAAAMYAWLRAQVPAGAAFVAALIYLVAPYHLIDDFYRASLGEVAAYAVLPLVALALRQAARDPLWIPILGLSYAALIISHVAVAVLTSATLVPVFGVFLLMQAKPAARAAVLLRGLAGLGLGVLLAGSYILPAVLMQNAAPMAPTWAAGGPFDPASWTLLNVRNWPAGPLAVTIAWLGGLYGVTALVVLGWSLWIKAPRAAPAMVWAATAALGVVMYAAPWIWHAPLLNRVQFPFRLFGVVEFSLITALALAFTAGGGWRLALPAALPVALLAIPFADTVWPSYARTMDKSGSAYAFVANRVAHRIAPPEYLPLGYAARAPFLYEDIKAAPPYAGTPLIQLADPAARLVSAKDFPDGGLRIEVNAPRATTIVARRFYFAAWRANAIEPRVGPDLPLRPDGPQRLVSFGIPPGHSVFWLRVVRTPIEKAGDAVSLVGLGLGMGFWVLEAGRRIRARRGVAGAGFAA